MDNFVSVVTICRNDSSGLSRTILSLKEQDFFNWKSVIVLGKSEDNSEEVALNFEKMDSRIQVISQESSGIYQAMNNGLYAADGKFVWFMNSGDIFADAQALGIGINQIISKGAVCVIGGYEYAHNSILVKYSKRSKELSSLAFNLNIRGGCHQAMIFRTKYLKDLNGFNLEYSLASDFDLVLRLFSLGKVFRCDKILARIEPGGVSHKQIGRVLRQKQHIRKVLFPSNFIIIWLGLIWTRGVKLKIFIRSRTY